MFFRLLILFAAVPVLEIALLIKVGSFIGVMNTVMIVIITAITGAYLVKREGLGVMQRIQTQLGMGIFPGDELIDGAMLLVSGALLLTPGFFTDTLGFLLLIPATRGFFRGHIKDYLLKRVDIIDITPERDRQDNQ